MLEKSSDNDPANVQVYNYIKCTTAPVNILIILSKNSLVTKSSWMYLVERSGHSVKKLLGEDGGLPAAGGVDDHHAACGSDGSPGSQGQQGSAARIPGEDKGLEGKTRPHQPPDQNLQSQLAV